MLSLLAIDHNRLTGTIPKSLSNLTLIQNLEMQDNMLSGPFLHEFYPLSLNVINIGNNKFTGVVPTSIFKSSVLQVYVMSSNCFSTSIPSVICACTSLEYIVMNGIGTNPG